MGGSGLIGVTAGSFAWRDPEEAVAIAVDACGFDRIEFDTARLAPAAYPLLGLLTQRFGASVGLEAAIDPAAAAPGALAAALDALRQRCEEALADTLLLRVAPGRADSEDRLAAALRGALPGYAATGVRICLPAERASLLDIPEVSLCLELPRDRPSLTTLLARHGARIGCVRARASATSDSLAALEQVAASGFRGPYVLALAEPACLGTLRTLGLELRRRLSVVGCQFSVEGKDGR